MVGLQVTESLAIQKLTPLSSVDEVSHAYLSIIKEIGKTYGLSVNGAILAGATPTIGNITLTVNQPGSPSPITPTDSAAFEVFSKSVQAAFGKDVVTAPSSMTGNTDTRHYVSRLCNHDDGV